MGFFINDRHSSQNFEYQRRLMNRSSDFNGLGRQLDIIEKERTLIDKIRMCEEEGIPVSVVSVKVDENSGTINDLFSDFRLRPSDGSVLDLFGNNLTFVLTATDWAQKLEFIARVEKHLAAKGLQIDSDWKFDGAPATYENPSQLARITRPIFSDDKQYFSDILFGITEYDPDKEVYLFRDNTPIDRVLAFVESAHNDSEKLNLLRQIKTLYVNSEGSKDDDYIVFSEGPKNFYLSQFNKAVRQGTKGATDTIGLGQNSVAVIIKNNLPENVTAGYDSSKCAVVCNAK